MVLEIGSWKLEITTDIQGLLTTNTPLRIVYCLFSSWNFQETIQLLDLQAQ
jgi:hypothetical protein